MKKGLKGNKKKKGEIKLEDGTLQNGMTVHRVFREISAENS